jgi:hypothetical protein
VLLAHALRKRFGGARVDEGLVRTEDVDAAHLKGEGERPSVAQHQASMKFTGQSVGAHHVILVDDVATRGSTATGARLVLSPEPNNFGEPRLIAAAWTRLPREPHVEHMRFTIKWWNDSPHAKKYPEGAACASTVWLAPGSWV